MVFAMSPVRHVSERHVPSTPCLRAPCPQYAMSPVRHVSERHVPSTPCLRAPCPQYAMSPVRHVSERHVPSTPCLRAPCPQYAMSPVRHVSERHVPSTPCLRAPCSLCTMYPDPQVPYPSLQIVDPKFSCHNAKITTIYPSTCMHPYTLVHACLRYRWPQVYGWTYGQRSM